MIRNQYACRKMRSRTTLAGYERWLGCKREDYGASNVGTIALEGAIMIVGASESTDIQDSSSHASSRVVSAKLTIPNQPTEGDNTKRPTQFCHVLEAAVDELGCYSS